MYKPNTGGTKMNNRIKVYTDGACQNNQLAENKGGYGAVIFKPGEEPLKLNGGFRNTTNNRMELYGVLETLKHFDTPTQITIYSDSQYVVGSINNGHLEKWISSNDFSKKNLDLWRQIYEYLKIHDTRFIWVKGHNENSFNEMADLYACHAAECLNLQEDKINE